MVTENFLLPLLRNVSGPQRPRLTNSASSFPDNSSSCKSESPEGPSSWKSESPEGPSSWNSTSKESTGPRNPRVIWASIHSCGILHNGNINPAVVKYSEEIPKVLQAWNVPELDTFDLTSRGVISRDGSHFGLVVNAMKATVLLNYLSQLQDRQEW
ncbi:hypothetical protein V1264_010012 [Littorina saxatilis]|uniref:Uncharacterized protein n=1 Tax=Littorina saxatilis TaxID=31220 RepID=A0AAN9ANN8_9CAEN